MRRRSPRRATRSVASPVSDDAFGVAPRGVIFDLDGTLVDSYDAIAESLNAARAAFALQPLAVDEVRRLVGDGLESLIERQLGAARVEQGVQHFRQRYAAIYLERTTALPGVVEGLAKLRSRGYRMGVASNKPARFSAPLVRALGLGGAISSVQGPDLVGSTKPDPAMLRASLQELALAADEALYVGDMVLDVESGRRAGVAVALVAGGSSSRDELRETGRPVFEHFADLIAALGDPALPRSPARDVERA